MNFTRNGLRLGSRHQEPPHTDVSRNLATVFLLLSHSWTTDNVRGVLPGLRRRRTGLLPSGPKSSFRWEQVCISFGNQGPRVWRKGGEAHSPSCMKSSVKIPQYVMIWVQCHLLVLDHLCFLKTNVTAPVYQDILEHFMLSSAVQLLKMLSSFSSRIGTCPHCQKHQKLVKWPWCWCAWLASKLTRPEPMGYCQRKMRKRDQKIQMSWRPLSKKPGLPYHLSSATNWSPPCHAELRQ